MQGLHQKAQNVDPGLNETGDRVTASPTLEMIIILSSSNQQPHQYKQQINNRGTRGRRRNSYY